MNAVKNEMVAMPARQIEMLAIRIAPKKHSQCTPTMHAHAEQRSICGRGGRTLRRRNTSTTSDGAGRGQQDGAPSDQAPVPTARSAGPRIAVVANNATSK